MEGDGSSPLFFQKNSPFLFPEIQPKEGLSSLPPSASRLFSPPDNKCRRNLFLFPLLLEIFLRLTIVVGFFPLQGPKPSFSAAAAGFSFLSLELKPSPLFCSEIPLLRTSRSSLPPGNACEKPFLRPFLQSGVPPLPLSIFSPIEEAEALPLSRVVVHKKTWLAKGSPSVPPKNIPPSKKPGTSFSPRRGSFFLSLTRSEGLFSLITLFFF